VLEEELGCGLERALLASLDLWLAQVAAHGETVLAAGEVLAHVSGSVLAIAQQLVRHLLLLGRELLVDLARVDQDGVI
jgi:hypothetical protein